MSTVSGREGEERGASYEAVIQHHLIFCKNIIFKMLPEQDDSDWHLGCTNDFDRVTSLCWHKSRQKSKDVKKESSWKKRKGGSQKGAEEPVQNEQGVTLLNSREQGPASCTRTLHLLGLRKVAKNQQTWWQLSVEGQQQKPRLRDTEELCGGKKMRLPAVAPQY